MSGSIRPLTTAAKKNGAGESEATAARTCSLLIESAHAILRSEHSLAKWGKKLLAKKGSLKLAVAAMARKLVVAVWYLMMGRWTPLEEIDVRVTRKVGKIITNVGPEGLKTLGKTRKALRQETYESLKAGAYVLDPTKKFHPKPKAGSLAAEYGFVR